MILVFAGLGMFFTSYIYRYNLIYVYDTGPDSKGLFYPRALMQLMTGLYIAEVCLIGLFALKSSFGPLLLMVIFLVFTALVHISLSEAMTPLLNKLPRTLALEKDMGPIAQDEQPGDDTAHPAPYPTGGLAADYYNMTDDDDSDSLPGDAPNHDLDTDIQLRGIEGSSSLKYQLGQWTKSLFKSTFTTSPPPASDSQPHTATTNLNNPSRLTRILTQIKLSITPDPSRPPNILLTFLHPEIYQSFRLLQPHINPGPDPDAHPLPADYAKRAYWPPEMWTPAPRLWLPRDDARVSRQEVAHCAGSVAAASDRASWLAETARSRKGRGGVARVECRMEESPLLEGEARWVY